jgi:hypothetical protein
MVSNSTNGASGSVGWTFSVADGVLDFLAAGKTPVQKYNVTVGDNMAAPWCKPTR